MFVARRPTSRIDVGDYNTVLYRDNDANVNSARNYLLSQSPPPMSYRDLRSVMSNISPSNVLIVAETSTPTQIRVQTSPNKTRRRSHSRKKQKRQPVDVYRTLPQPESRCSIAGERDINNDGMMLLAKSFVVEHPTPAPSSGFFYPQNLPNIQKQRAKTGKSSSKSTQSSSSGSRNDTNGQPGPKIIDLELKESIREKKTWQTRPLYTSSSTRIPPIRYSPPTPPQMMHRTSPIDLQYEEEDDNCRITVTITSTTGKAKDSLPISEVPSLPEVPTRRQLHVYIPQIISC